jgi:hypothetical protein
MVFPTNTQPSEDPANPIPLTRLNGIPIPLQPIATIMAPSSRSTAIIPSSERHSVIILLIFALLLFYVAFFQRHCHNFKKSLMNLGVFGAYFV